MKIGFYQLISEPIRGAASHKVGDEIEVIYREPGKANPLDPLDQLGFVWCV